MKSIRCAVAAAFASVFCIHADAANLYVSLSGDDGNDGSAPDAEHALRTVEAGVEKARDYILVNPEDTATINIGEGEFALTQGIVLPANTTLKGSGRDDTILNAVSLLADTAANGAVSVVDAKSCVESLTITNGIPAGAKLQDCVRCVYITAGAVTDCRMTGACLGSANGKTAAGFYMTDGIVSNCVIDHCSITDSYNGGGAGAYVYKNGTVVDCEFFENFIDYNYSDYASGTALRLATVSSGNKIMIRRCSFHDNGLARCPICVVRTVKNSADEKCIENCLFYGNRATAGTPVIWADGENSVIRYCTIAGNSGMCGLKFGYWYKCEARNCIVWGNANEGVDEITFTAAKELGKSTLVSNLLTRALSGREDGYIVGNPMLVDVAAGDLHLGSRDSGAFESAQPIAAVKTDYALNERGEKPSIGAYEWDPSAVSLKVTIFVPASDVLKGDARATATVSGAESGEYEVEWFLDDVLVGTGLEMTFTTADYGTHDIRAVVTTTDGRTVSSDIKNAFTIRTDIAYVNNTGSGVYPYATPQTATNDLGEAVNAVWAGAPDPRVSVAAESIALPGTVTVSCPVRIFGEGADKTRLTCENIKGSALTVNHAKCRISDLTIADGNCRAVDLRAGELFRCVITNFSFLVTGGYSGLGVLMGADGITSTGVLRDCEIVDCRLESHYCSGAGISIHSISAVVTNCTVRNCYAQTLTGSERGGGIYCYDGKLYNTRIVDCGRGDKSLRGMALYMRAAAFARGCVIEGTQQGSSTYPVVLIDGDWGTTFENCTVAANGNGSAAVEITDKTIAKSVMRNTVIYGNDTTAQLVQNGGTVTYCCYAEATEGVDGNRTPKGRMFRNLSRRDFHPIYGSPCLDSGSNQGWMTGATDLTGAPRIIHDIVDIGALESNPPGLLLLVY